MATVKQMLDRLDAYIKGIPALAEAAFNAHSETAADMNAAQLGQGLKTDGQKSDYPYAPLTVALKRGKPGLSGVTAYLTNYDTGASYRGLYAKAEAGRITYGTTTDKEEAINDRMDDMAFGLTPDNFSELRDAHLLPSYTEAVKEILKVA